MYVLQEQPVSFSDDLKWNFKWSVWSCKDLFDYWYLCERIVNLKARTTVYCISSRY